MVQKVIQRHFWLKRYAIIEQARKWMEEMRKDAAEAERNPKKKDNISFEAMFNPMNQVKTGLIITKRILHINAFNK